MSSSVLKYEFRGKEGGSAPNQTVPTEVVQARNLDWGVIVDAYLVGAARVGDRFAARVFHDLSGVNENAMTVVTPPLQEVERRYGFKLMRSVSGVDYFVIASELSSSTR
ncbi:hypothetical protein [Pseudomonas alliivorans]|jgi:hypothetical protein|uniref:hypothetical protein n=1 Tax=Pseudomonas alliivorans TaxID=2810613 RepID=UPI00403B0320